MTTIAYRDGILVTDSAASSNGVLDGRIRKAVIIREHVIGFAGAAGQCVQVLRLIAEQHKEPLQDLVSFEEPSAWFMRIDKRGYVEYLEPDCWEWFALEAPFHAMGSGKDIAMGAMQVGASAYEAVSAAAALDSSTAKPLYRIDVAEVLKEAQIKTVDKA